MIMDTQIVKGFLDLTKCSLSLEGIGAGREDSEKCGGVVQHAPHEGRIVIERDFAVLKM